MTARPRQETVAALAMGAHWLTIPRVKSRLELRDDRTMLSAVRLNFSAQTERLMRLFPLADNEALFVRLWCGCASVDDPQREEQTADQETTAASVPP